MAKMLQVRNLPEDVHAKLAARAKKRGVTLSAYVAEILRRETARESWEEINERLRKRGPIDIGDIDIASEIRAARREAGRE